MLQKLKDNIALVLALVALVAILLNFKQCGDVNAAKQNAKDFDRAISAITDSIKKTVNKQGDTVFVKRAVQFELKDLVNSESFKNLSEQNKQFYLELQKVKGLVASSQATIQSQAELIKSLTYGKNVTVTDSSVCFQKHSNLVLQDSTKSLHFTHTLTFDKELKSDLKYSYNATIKSTFIRNKDKSIRIEYKLDDPNASVINGQAFVVPFEYKNKFSKFLERTGKWLIPSVAFIGGAYIGYQILK